MRPLGRSVAQPGSASVWGTGGRGFESRRSDQFACARRRHCTSKIAMTRFTPLPAIGHRGKFFTLQRKSR